LSAKTGQFRRQDGRNHDELRAISFEAGFSKYAEGSVLARFGETQVLCNASVEERVPAWLQSRQPEQGWVTAEYAMLPRSTHSRVSRESRWPRGRTQEISRLIGRSMRMAVDMAALGQRTVLIDCDVLQADGGTRTAAISGAWLALRIALDGLVAQGVVSPDAIRRQIGAISVGMVNGVAVADLSYIEDASADVDLNLVMTAAGDIIEIQGTAEKNPLSQSDLRQLVELGSQGIDRVIQAQQAILASG